MTRKIHGTPEKRYYSTFDIERMFGIKRSRLKEWIPKYIQPSIKKSTGQGSKNLFSFSDVLYIIKFTKLVDMGLYLKAAKKMIEDGEALKEMCKEISEYQKYKEE